MLFKDSLLDKDDLQLSRAVPILDHGSIEPDLCVTEDGGWLIWTQHATQGDRICLRSFSDTGYGEILDWSSTTGIEYQPTLIALSDARILGVHVARREGVYQLIARILDADSLSDEVVIYENVSGLFHPRLLAVGEQVWLVCEVVDEKNTQLMTVRFTSGQWGEAHLIAGASSWCSRPVLASTPDNAVWCAYDAYEDGSYNIYLQRIDEASEPLAVTQGGFQSVQPALASDASGKLWIAYASNANRARRDAWWLTKWNEIRCFDGQTFYDLPAQPERDIYQDDSFQGWEFPALLPTAKGEVWLFGQSAHTLYMAGCGQSGWSDLYPMDQKHWGSWKPRIRVSGQNPTYIVSMGLHGAQLQRMELKNIQPTPPLLRLHQSPPAKPLTLPSEDERASLLTNEGQTLNYYFGDLHCHSIYGDATNDVDEVYHRYRDAYGYDFATLTEHDYLDDITLSHSELNMLWNVAKRMSESGRFIAMYGYEWTSPAIAEHAAEGTRIGEGHRQVIYPDDQGALISYGEPESNTGAKLLAKLQGQRALVIPHHTSWSGTDWDAHDPEIQRVVEICSTHGRFEYAGNLPIGYRRDHIHPQKFVQDALERGYRLGFVGGSDSHGLRWHATEPEGRDSLVPAGTRVGWTEDSYRSGMTVVLAPELTREAVYDGIYQRRCYATSGVPIILDFRVNGELMGSEIISKTAPKIHISVTGTAPLHSVEVIRSGQVFGGIHAQPGEAIQTLQFDLEDKIMISGESHYYYLRVLQSDGNMAWSSPIWVHYDRKH